MIPVAFSQGFKYMNTKNRFQLELADRVIEVHSLYETCMNYCKQYVIPMDEYSTPDFTVDIVLRNIRRENDFYQKNNPSEYGDTYLYYNPGYLEFYAIHRKICEFMPFFDTFLMHGSVVSYQGKAYMFTAPSGTGKTTRTSLWLQEFPGSIVVNGDKPFIRVMKDCVLAYGSPWCGKEGWNTNIGVPLQAIFLLERSDTDSTISRLSLPDVFNELLRQTFIPHSVQSMSKTVELINKLNGKVDFYHFRSVPSRESVRMAWNVAH